MNALKHGLAAESFALLPGEDPAQFAALHAALVERYAPADPTAAFLVRRLASAIWRARRAEALEVEVLTTRERRPDPSSVSGYNPASPAMWDAGRLSACLRYEGRIERSFLASLRPLEEHAAAAAQAVEEQNEPKSGDVAAVAQDATAAVQDAAEEKQNEPERTPVGEPADIAPAASGPKPAQTAASSRSWPGDSPSPAVIARLLAGGYAPLPAGPAGGRTPGGGAGEARGLPRQSLSTSSNPKTAGDVGQEAPGLTSAARAACPR